MQLAISSGHGKYIRGASGILDEVNEARRVVEKVAQFCEQMDVSTETFHDDISDDQNENLNRIVDWHNSQTRDLDISVHFNAYEPTSKPMGTECLYVTQETLAGVVADKISDASGLIDRGPKYRSDLFFLNNTAEPAILIEVCFVDSETDASLYNESFDDICQAIAEAVTGRTNGEPEEPVDPEEPDNPGNPGKPEPPDRGQATIDIRTTGNVRITVNGQPVKK